MGLARGELETNIVADCTECTADGFECLVDNGISYCGNSGCNSDFYKSLSNELKCDFNDSHFEGCENIFNSQGMLSITMLDLILF